MFESLLALGLTAAQWSGLSLFRPTDLALLFSISSRADDRRNKTFGEDDHDRIHAPTRCGRNAALLGLMSAVAFPARAQAPDAIYTAAKTEGAFVLYVGGPTAPWEATARSFEQRYPGIKVAITGGFSNVLDKKIDQQIKDGKLEVDTAIFQTLQDFVRWKAEGQLLPYKPPGFDAIDHSFKDAEGAFYGVMVNAMPYMYNTEQVAAADVPEFGAGFSQAAVQGQDGHALPGRRRRDPVAVPPHRAEIRLGLHGQVHGQQAELHPGPSRPAAQHRAGQNWVTFDSIFNITTVEKKAGKPVESHFSTKDATPIWPLTGAIFKDAPHPNAAKLFLGWLLEPAQQVATGTWSGAQGRAAAGGLQADLRLSRSSTTTSSFLVNERELVALRKRFEGYTGPVVNAGGVR